MIPAWPAVSCLVLVLSWYSVKVISEPDRSMRWKLLVLERARNFPGYLSLAVSGETGRAPLGLMLRLWNLSCFIVPADVWHAILHLFVMQSACMLAHIILSASLLLPPPPTPFGLFMLKITSRFMTMKGMGARERKTCWLKDSWPYLPPSTASLDHLYLRNFIPDSGKGEKGPNLRRLSTIYIKIFSAMEVKGKIDSFRHSRLLSSLWCDQRLLRGFNGWLIQERTPKP